MRAGLVLCVLLAAVGSADQSKENRFVGTWSADLTKSRLDPKYQYRSATLHISVAGDSVTMASVVVNASGQEQRAAETFRTDGTETPGTLTPGVSHVARWVGAQVLATIALKEGQLFALMTYEVSADGKTLTARSSGVADQVLVFHRQ